MRNKLIILLLGAMCVSVLPMYAQMTDDAIIAYLTEGVAAGKSEAQLGNELLAKGVSASQIQRLLKVYQQQGGSTNIYTARESRKLDNVRTARKDPETDDNSNSITKVVGKDGKEVSPKKGQPDDEMVRESSKLKKKERDGEEETVVKRIFGQDIFSGRTLSFEPNVNAATPEDYVLGPGDEIVIDIWGQNEATMRQVISPEGRIIVSGIGSINLGGLTIKQASGKIRSAFSKRYAGIMGNNPSSQISVTLGQIRSIQVNILGEVDTPGTYRLSSFTTVFNAIYKAGGVTPSGSLRAIDIIRAGEKIATVDVYDYLFNGKMEVNIPLKEGDVILVPVYGCLVGIEGGVKRPMYYEMKDGEHLSNLIAFAGGFTGDAFRSSVNVVRSDGTQSSMNSIEAAQFDTFSLSDADIVTVAKSTVDTYANMVEIKGAVFHPGMYELGNGVATVSQLVTQAGGLLEEAFRNRAQIIREKNDRTLEIVAVAIGAIMDGTAEDILLRRNDQLVIANVNEITEFGDLTITGYVHNPGRYEYAENTSLEDLIMLAGGLSDGASTVKVDVSRRIYEPASNAAADSLAQIFTFSIADGLMMDGKPDFILKPYDVVSVRRSPTYVEQRNVSISGEVTFPGQYTLASNSERISELVRRAGGPSVNAYVEGAMLRRKISQYERNVRQGISRTVAQQDDNEKMNAEKLKVSEIYTVGLELDKALANPGTDYDVILRDGDELIIPEKTTTVRIQGEVLYPNTVHYISNSTVRYYVRQAGGFSNNAKRHKTYVLYMNGTISTGMGARIEPGCEIIVPRRPERQEMSPGDWVSIGTASASIGTMIATVVNLIIRK